MNKIIFLSTINLNERLLPCERVKVRNYYRHIVQLTSIAHRVTTQFTIIPSSQSDVCHTLLYCATESTNVHYHLQNISFNLHTNRWPSSWRSRSQLRGNQRKLCGFQCNNFIFLVRLWRRAHVGPLHVHYYHRKLKRCVNLLHSSHISCCVAWSIFSLSLSLSPFLTI